MTASIFVVLSLAFPATVGRAPECSPVRLKVVQERTPPSRLEWRVLVENRTKQEIELRVSKYRFYWTIFERESGTWHGLLSGGIVPGVAEQGQEPATDPTTRVVPRGGSITVASLGGRRDEDWRGLESGALYRIVFEQDVGWVHPGGAATVCTLTSAPLEFRPIVTETASQRGKK